VGLALALAGAGCGGPTEPQTTPSDRTGAQTPTEDPPPAPEAPERSSGAFAFETRPPGIATVVDDARGLYAIVSGVGAPEAAARALPVARAELAGRSAEDLVEGLEAANRAVHALRTDDEAGPAAEAAAVVVDAQGAHLARVGAVRVYRLRDGTLERWTGPEGSDRLGAASEVEVSTATRPVAPGDTLVLVAAGVHRFVDDAAMARLLAEAGPDPEAMARRIVEESAGDASTAPRAAVVVHLR
jgi:hypothetical protein